jgi:hypothetical protein
MGRAVATALLTVLAATAAEDPPPGADDARRAAAARLVAYGNWCRGRSYKGMAREPYEEALRLDPGCAEARVALGHRLQDGKWRI